MTDILPIETFKPWEKLGKPGKRMWDELLPICEKRLSFERSDVIALTNLCKCADEIAECEASLKEIGVSYVGASIHPENRRMREAQTLMLKYLEHFGLTPKSRRIVAGDGIPQMPGDFKARKRK